MRNDRAAHAGHGARFEVWGVSGVPEVRPGDDLVELLVAALAEPDGPLADGDIVVVTSKIISKAEGRVLTGVDRDAAIDAEAVRTVSEWTTPRGRTRVVETRHGFVMAAAGVDASNVETGTVVLLPTDPDASARRLRDGLRARLGVRVGVILTDTAGRVWRNGVVDMAIGAAGVTAVDDLRGRTDRYGNDLGVTVVAVVDELAAATELVRTKLSHVPLAVVRGLPHLVLPEGAPDPGASVLVRPSAEDRFRLGTPEAMREAVLARRSATSFTSDPADAEAVRRAVGAALTAPAPPHTDREGPAEGPTPVRFALLESQDARAAFAAALDKAVPAAATGHAQQLGLLTSATSVVVPCLTDDTDLTMLALGAAVENLLIALSAEGLAAAWLFPSVPLAQAASTALELPVGWAANGAIAVGHTADHPAERAARALDELTVTR